MAIKYSEAIKNAQLNQVEGIIGTDAILEIRTGSAPATVADARTGDVLIAITLPTNWMDAASGSSVAKAGTWSGTATGDGDAGYYTIYASDGTTAGMQGAITATGDGGDLTLDNISIATGQTVTIATFTIAAGN
jgi:hypothetical protein